MQYKNFALELARQAGNIIKKNFTLGMKKEWKADSSPITRTDLAINALVLESVKKRFPAHGILAEEGSDFSRSAEYVWVCDPLDGTVPFSHGIPICVFSLALTHKGQSILGVVYDPFLDRMFFAEKDKGATLNNKKIAVSTAASLQKTLFCVASGKAEVDFLPLIRAMRDEGAMILDPYSITYMGTLVASGECGGTIFQGVTLQRTKPHDTAALKVLVEEAGGKVTDLFGREQRYDRVIRGQLASNGLLHDTLLKLIREHVKMQPA